MSKASNLAGFVTSISPINNLNVGVITASSFVGDLTGTATTATSAGTAYELTGSPDVTVGIITATVISAGSTTGTDGQVLQSTGAGVTWTDAASGGISVTDSNLIGYNSAGIRSDSANGRLEVFGTGNFQVFTSPGTYIVNPGISSIRVRVVGAGGNGATGDPAPVTPSINGAGGGGGGGGGYAHKVVTSFTAPRSYAVTVGTSPGGTSSFGSEVSATGGSPGSVSAGGAGGTGSDGDVNYTGATGTNGLPEGSSPTTGFGGRGGASATQKGDGSGSSVPGLTGLSGGNIPSPDGGGYHYGALDTTYVNRFPFDIFNGYNGSPTGGPPGMIPKIIDGANGGSASYKNSPVIVGNSGYAAGGAAVVGPNKGPGGNGGISGGGGGGGGGNWPAGLGYPGGAGGDGIVIVEW